MLVDVLAHSSLPPPFDERCEQAAFTCPRVRLPVHGIISKAFLEERANRRHASEARFNSGLDLLRSGTRVGLYRRLRHLIATPA